MQSGEIFGVPIFIVRARLSVYDEIFGACIWFRRDFRTRVKKFIFPSWFCGIRQDLWIARYFQTSGRFFRIKSDFSLWFWIFWRLPIYFWFWPEFFSFLVGFFEDCPNLFWGDQSRIWSDYSVYSRFIIHSIQDRWEFPCFLFHRREFFSLQWDFWENNESFLGPAWFISVYDEIFKSLARVFGNWLDFLCQGFFYLRRHFFCLWTNLFQVCLSIRSSWGCVSSACFHGAWLDFSNAGYIHFWSRTGPDFSISGQYPNIFWLLRSFSKCKWFFIFRACLASSQCFEVRAAFSKCTQLWKRISKISFLLQFEFKLNQVPR